MQKGYPACRISYATTWLADELVKLWLNATLGSLDKHCTPLYPCPDSGCQFIRLWIYATPVGSKNADLSQEWLLKPTLQSHPCSSVWMCLASLCNMLFPTCVLPSAGMRIYIYVRSENYFDHTGKQLENNSNYWNSLLSFDLVNVAPCSVKKTTVTGCPCRSETYCNGGHWRTCKDGVFGLTGSVEAQTKAMKSGWFQWRTRPSTPHPGQEFWSALHHKWPHKSLQSGSLMVLAVKPLKRELELLLSKHEPHRSFIVPRTAWGSGWISEATCRNAYTVNNHNPSPR